MFPYHISIWNRCFLVEKTIQTKWSYQKQSLNFHVKKIRLKSNCCKSQVWIGSVLSCFVYLLILKWEKKSGHFIWTCIRIIFIPLLKKIYFWRDSKLYVMPFMCASLHHHEMRKDFGRKFVPPSGHDAIWRPYLGSFLNIMPEIVRCHSVFWAKKNSSKRREISTPS